MLTGQWAASADKPFRHLSAEELQYADVLTQDHAGFLWAGTETGLVRWDGYRTKIYTSVPGDPTSMPAGSVKAIFAESSGALWVGAGVGGLARYVPGTDTFAGVGGGPAGLQNSNVSAITADLQGGLWIGTGTGLDHVDPIVGRVRHETGEADHTGAVTSIVQDTDGGLWIGTAQGLFHRRPHATRFDAIPLGPLPNQSARVRTLCRDHVGRLWIGTHSNGLLVIEPGRTDAHPVGLSADRSADRGSPINAIVDAGRDGIWLSTLGHGIALVQPDAGWRVRYLRHETGIASSLLDDDVRSLYVGRDHMVWAATTLGLSRHNLGPDGVWTLFGEKSRNRSIPSGQVPVVLAHPDGRVWLGLGNGGGAVILDSNGTRVGEMRPDSTRPAAALPGSLVTAMLTTPGGDVLMATTQGLFLADLTGRKVTRLELPQRAPDAAVHAIAFVGDTLWVGGNDGLWAVGLQPGRTLRLVAHVPASQIGNSRVTVLLHGDGDALWIGTESGLSRLQTATGQIDKVQADDHDPSAFVPAYVTTLLLDPQHRLWVGSLTVGLQVLLHDADATSPMRFQRITVRDGLPSASLDMLLSDNAGGIWASTDNGLVVFDARTLAFRTLGESAGVAIFQYWSGAGARTATGDLLFGGIGGVTVVQPRVLKVRSGPPPLVVTEANVGGRALVASGFNIPGAPREIVIQAGERDLSVEFAALDFAASEQNRYSYRLEGYDVDWVPTVARRRLASFTNLPPGDYTLQLRGTGPDRPWTPATLPLTVRVLPKWYQTVWFKVAMSVLGVCALFAVVRLRTRFLERQRIELHALVALRTEELQASQRQLEQMAYADPLTGLANRRRFNKDVGGMVELALRGTLSVTLLLIDLDRFKEVNDSLGHDAGDALLVEVARRLTVSLRLSDRVARLGGDEFAVLMVDSERTDVEVVCKRIIGSVNAPFAHAGQILQVGASIGAASCPLNANSIDALYKCADTALYAAKGAGRNTWRAVGLKDDSAHLVTTTATASLAIL